MATFPDDFDNIFLRPDRQEKAYKIMKISVIITNYNKSNLIDRAIRSIENQLLVRHDIEIIIVDDCSTDSPQLWLDKYQNDRKVKILYLDKNIGVAGASNYGYSSSTGDYIMRLDADDYLSQMFCEFSCDLLEYNNNYGYIYSDIVWVDTYGNKEKIIDRGLHENLLEYGAGVVVRREVIEKNGFYDSDLRNCEDRDFIMKLDNKEVVGFHISVPYYRYYNELNSLTKKKDRKIYKKQVENKWDFI